MNQMAKPVLEKYGRWNVLRRSGSIADSPAYECRCDCGTVRTVPIRNLRHGTSQSCGCLRIESTRIAHITHGESSPSSPEYRAWASMINRCHQSSVPKKINNYQNRGIVVCERWRESFDNFLSDMGRRPSEKHSLDRYPNNDGNYEPSNCRWATAKEQSNNRRRRITTKTKLASALLALGHVPYEHSKIMTADQIISLYHFDHSILHSTEPIDEPWNLTPRLIMAHREKSKRDTSIAAKSKRLIKREEEHRLRMQRLDDPLTTERPKREIPSRPFGKQHRKLQSRSTFARSNR